MHDSFDPYREWLGIDDGPRPPNHYRLLDLRPGESDPKAIALAADLQSARVRKVRPGNRAPDWGRLLDHIQSAKVCLLDPNSKAVYDRSIGLAAAPGGSAQPGGGVPGSAPGPGGGGAPMALPPGMAGPAGAGSPVAPAFNPAAPAGSPTASPPWGAGRTAQPAEVPLAQPQTPTSAPNPSAGTSSPWENGYPAAPAWPAGVPHVPAAIPQGYAAMPQGVAGVPQAPTAIPQGFAAVPQGQTVPQWPAVPQATLPAVPQSPSSGVPQWPAAPQAPFPAVPQSPLPGVPVGQPVGLPYPTDYGSGGYASAPSGGRAAQPSPDPWSLTPDASPRTPDPQPLAAGPSLRAAQSTPSASYPAGRSWAWVATIGLLLVAAGLGVVILYLQTHDVDLASLGLAGREPTGHVPADPSEVDSGAAPRDATSGPADTSGAVARVEPRGTTPAPSVSSSPGTPTGQPAQAAIPQPPDSVPTQPRPGGGAEDQPDPPAERQDPARRKAFDEAVADIWFALGDRDVADARRAVAQAKANAQTQADREQTAQLETLANIVEQFWEGIRKGMSRLEAMGELPIGETFIAIVEASSDHIIVKAAGVIRSYQVRNMPPKLVMAIADQYFVNDAVAKLLKGGYLAVDPDGDRHWARDLWQEAARGQTGIDVAWLMTVLEGAPPPRPSRAGSSPRPGPPTLGSLVSSGAALPEGEALKSAEAAVREKYGARIDSATGPAEKAELARQLLADAAAAATPETRFVMLRESKDLAAAAGQALPACAAVDEMAQHFSVDAVGLKLAALKLAGQNARGTTGHRDVAMASLGLLHLAADQKRLDEAKQLTDLALSSARESKSAALMKQAAAAGQQVDALRGRQ